MKGNKRESNWKNMETLRCVTGRRKKATEALFFIASCQYFAFDKEANDRLQAIRNRRKNSNKLKKRGKWQGKKKEPCFESMKPYNLCCK